MNKLIHFLIPGLLFISCNNTTNIKNPVKKDGFSDNKPFINLPLNTCQVPTEEYTVEAEKGAIIYTYSGTIIEFPANAFLDENGNIAKGNVNITYRNFSDPVDFFLSGITMEYDSGGVNYSFQSVAMCEINATLNNKKLFVNPKAKTTLNIPSNAETDVSNLYYLDTLAKKWVEKGREIRIAINNNIAMSFS